MSDYLSPGFRLAGLIKPDITAPGTYAISALSRDARVLARKIDDSDKSRS